LSFYVSAIDCLEGLVSEMTYYVLSGMLNSANSLTHSLTGKHKAVNIIKVTVILNFSLYY